MDNNFISAEDVLDRWGPVVKTRVLAMSTDGKNVLIERLAAHAKQLGDEEWLDVQIDNFARFFWNLDPELQRASYDKITKTMMKNTAGKIRKDYIRRFTSRPQIMFGIVVSLRDLVKNTNKNLKVTDILPPEPKDENDGLASSPKEA